MFSLFGKTQEEIVVILDIGNGSISGALVKLTKNDTPTILYVHREPLTYMPEVTSQRLLANMLKLLKAVSENLQKNGLPRLKQQYGYDHVPRAFCTFSSPWFISQTRIVKIEKEKPFVVTNNFINSIIRKEEEQFRIGLQEGKYEQIFGEDVELLEKKIIHTKLNGYEVTHLIDKEGTEVELTFFSSFISKKILDAVEHTLHTAFHFKSIEYSSFALASWSAVRDMSHTTQDFLFMDITGEVTDITLTSRGVLTETISFPYGRGSLLRTVVEQLTIPPEVALSFLIMQQKGTIEKGFAEKMEKTSADALESWRTQLFKALTELQKFNLLPKKVFVTVDADISSYFINALKKPLPIELNISHDTFDIHMLDGEEVRPFVHVAHDIVSDPFIIIESIFINKLVW